MTAEDIAQKRKDLQAQIKQKEKALLETLVLKRKQQVVQNLKTKAPLLHIAKTHHINTRGVSMDFTDLHYQIPLYRDFPKMPYVVVSKSVQCGLSELFIVCSFWEAGDKGLTIFYILPKYELRNRFVNNRVDKLIRKVPYYNEQSKIAGGGPSRTALKQFGKGTLVYVGSNVESEFLEIPVDSIYIDEKDRCNMANLEMAPDRSTASPYKYQREISNPTIEGFGIDARYQESSKGLWMLKCSGCGQWFSPDFFIHVVREVDKGHYEAIDPDYAPGLDCKLLHNCPNGKLTAVDRLTKGEWVHEYPKRKWKGFQISKLYSKFTTLGEMVDKYRKAEGNAIRTQIFYNSDLGLPYSSEGTKLTDSLLNSCVRPYQLPLPWTSLRGELMIGIDVGSNLDYVIRERVVERGQKKRRLVEIGRAANFKILADRIRHYKAGKLKSVVIDGYPEVHEVASLKEQFPFVISCRFQKDLPNLAFDKEKRIISGDRTYILDSFKQAVASQEILNPRDASNLLGGSYYKMLKAPTRLLSVDENNPDRSRFIWNEGGKPDHMFLAEAYCLLADALMPEGGALDFYEDQFFKLFEDSNKNLPKELDNLKYPVSMSQQDFLQKLRLDNGYT